MALVLLVRELAAKIAKERSGTPNKARKARGVCTDDPPQDAEDDECEEHMAEPNVPTPLRVIGGHVHSRQKQCE